MVFVLHYYVISYYIQCAVCILYTVYYTSLHNNHITYTVYIFWTYYSIYEYKGGQCKLLFLSSLHKYPYIGLYYCAALLFMFTVQYTAGRLLCSWWVSVCDECECVCVWVSGGSFCPLAPNSVLLACDRKNVYQSVNYRIHVSTSSQVVPTKEHSHIAIVILSANPL